MKSALRKIRQGQGLERDGWCFRRESGQGSHPKGNLRRGPDESGDGQRMVPSIMKGGIPMLQGYCRSWRGPLWRRGLVFRLWVMTAAFKYLKNSHIEQWLSNFLTVTHGKKCILYCDPAHIHMHITNKSFTKHYKLWPALQNSPTWKRSETYSELIHAGTF